MNGFRSNLEYKLYDLFLILSSLMDKIGPPPGVLVRGVQGLKFHNKACGVSLERYCQELSLSQHDKGSRVTPKVRGMRQRSKLKKNQMGCPLKGIIKGFPGIDKM